MVSLQALGRGEGKERKGKGNAQGHDADGKSFQERVVEDPRLGGQDGRLVSVVACVEAARDARRDGQRSQQTSFKTERRVGR